MPSTQVVNTPIIIQQAWNDGLFSLREKRNGVARGTSIEEKCMYVLGLGWKYRGSSEVRDAEVENTLYVSLQGLTQESKFLKIGQVLWEQCDENFILKMISSLSNNTPSQSRIYQQISMKEQQNFKGYFSKANMKSINRNQLDPHSILNRESRQMSSNILTTQKNRDAVLAEKKKLEQSRIRSKGFERRIVKFNPANREIKKLAEELTVILRTIESNNISDIALGLGIEVQSGYNKRYLTEEIVTTVCTFVEKELMISRSEAGKGSTNVYLRQDPEGLDTIKRLLRYTHFALLVSDDMQSVESLNALNADLEEMRSRMALATKGKKFSLKKLDKKIDSRDKSLSKAKDIEGKSVITRGKSKGEVKVKGVEANKIYEFLLSQMSGQGKDDFSYILRMDENGNVLDSKKDIEAVGFWTEFNKTDVKMAMNIVGNDASSREKLLKLEFSRFSSISLLEQLIIISTSMGIDKTALTAITSSDAGASLGPNNPGLYLAAIIRRFLALQKEGNRFGVLGFGKGAREKNVNDIMSAINKNREAGERERERGQDAKTADGIFKPLSVDPKSFKSYQPVYIVGGSVYTFNAGGSGLGSGEEITPAFKEKVEKQVKWNKVFSGKRGRQAAFEMSSKGMNMGAFGTQEAPLTQESGESNQTYIRRVIEAKMMNELRDKGLKVNDFIQPVFLVNKGINTSNVETTALLNLIPTVLEAMPGIGTAAGMAVRALLQGEIDAAKNLPKFARGGSFTTRNTNVSQFISGDSINNRINPERVTIDWATQRVNVQPLNTTNNVTNVESGRITDPIMGTPTTIKVSDKSGKSSEAMSVYNAINPFDENLTSGGITATPMDVLVSLKESLVDILSTLVASSQTEQTNAAMTAKVVDAINNLNRSMKNESPTSTNLFGKLGPLARGE